MSLWWNLSKQERSALAANIDPDALEVLVHACGPEARDMMIRAMMAGPPLKLGFQSGLRLGGDDGQVHQVPPAPGDMEFSDPKLQGLYEAVFRTPGDGPEP